VAAQHDRLQRCLADVEPGTRRIYVIGGVGKRQPNSEGKNPRHDNAGQTRQQLSGDSVPCAVHGTLTIDGRMLDARSYRIETSITNGRSHNNEPQRTLG
jgi:hypothetical protein